jgi:hypothetical protein
LQGIGNAALVDQVNDLAASERAVGAALVQDFAEGPFVKDMGLLALPGTLGLIVALIAAGSRFTARPVRHWWFRPSSAYRGS